MSSCSKMRCSRRAICASRTIVCFALFSLSVLAARAQISFTAAVNLAVQNSPRVKAAQDDVYKAQSMLNESKDLYIPSVAMSGGAGYSYGITLSVPTIFTVNAQSLVYSSSQHFYIDAARLELQASVERLNDLRGQVEEDTASTYFELQHAEDADKTVTANYDAANHLMAIVEDRARVGFENPLDIKRAKLAALQMKLEHLHADDQLVSIRERFGELIGLPGNALVTVPESIPSMDNFDLALASASNDLDTPALLAAQANQHSLRQKALGDQHRIWRPQINSFGQYGRVSPINDVSDFYNLHGVYNTFSAGFQVQFPVFDKVLEGRANESRADATRAYHEVQAFRLDQNRNRVNLRHSINELKARIDISVLAHSIAEDELVDISARLQDAGNGQPALTPKEELAAQIKERQEFLNCADLSMQLRQTSVQLLRQSGRLESWLVIVAALRASQITPPADTCIGQGK